MLQYSIHQILTAYKENKDIVDAYIKNHPVELYNGTCNCIDDVPISDDCKVECAKILGMPIAIFIVFSIITFIIWTISIYVLWKKAPNMPSWAIILCALLLVFGGWVPMTPIIVITIASFIKK